MLTHHVGAPVAIPAAALRDGSLFMSVPADQFVALFTGVPTRTYVDPHHHYTITLDARTASEEPFYLPDSPVKPPPKKKIKGPKTRRTSHQLVAIPPPDHPLLGFSASPLTPQQPPQPPSKPPAHTAPSSTPVAALHTSQRVTLYKGSRVN